AERTLRDCVSRADKLGINRIAVAARYFLALTLSSRGELVEARAVAGRAVEEFTAQKNRVRLGSTRSCLAKILALLGDSVGAAREGAAGVEATEPGTPGRAEALAVLSEVALLGGRPVEALSAASAAAEILKTLGVAGYCESRIHLAHAAALSASGKREEARAV